MTEITAYCKGLAKPFNPGAGAWAFIVYRDGVKVAERKGVYKDPCYNWEAEYYAIWQALEFLVIKRLNCLPIAVKLDCGLVVKQLQTKVQVKQVATYKSYRRVCSLIQHFPFLRFEKIEKWENEADVLAQKAACPHASKILFQVGWLVIKACEWLVCAVMMHVLSAKAILELAQHR